MQNRLNKFLISSILIFLMIGSSIAQANNSNSDIKVSAEALSGCHMQVSSVVDFGVIFEFPEYNTIADWDSFPKDLNWFVQCTPNTVFTVLPFSTEQWVGAKASKITGIKLTNQTNPDASYPLSALIMFGVTPEEFVGGNATLHHTANPYRIITADGTKQKLKAFVFLENIWKVEGYSPTPGFYTGSTTLSIEY